MNDLDIHLTRLAGWLVNTVGRAIVIAFVITGVLGIGLAAAGTSLALTAFVAPVVFGLVLWLAKPPIPVDIDG